MSDWFNLFWCAFLACLCRAKVYKGLGVWSCCHSEVGAYSDCFILECKLLKSENSPKLTYGYTDPALLWFPLFTVDWWPKFCILLCPCCIPRLVKQ